MDGFGDRERLLGVGGGGGSGVLRCRRGVRREEKLRSLQDVLVAVSRIDEIVFGEIVPYESVLVAPGSQANHGYFIFCADPSKRGRITPRIHGKYRLEDQEYMLAIPLPRRKLRRSITSKIKNETMAFRNRTSICGNQSRPTFLQLVSPLR